MSEPVPSSLGPAIEALDRLLAAMKAGAGAAEVAERRAEYDFIEGRLCDQLDALTSMVSPPPAPPGEPS